MEQQDAHKTQSVYVAAVPKQAAVRGSLKKNWKGDGRCILSRVVESVDHIFFECVISSFIWRSCMEALGCDRPPANLPDFLNNWLPLGCSDYRLKLFQFGVVAWAIWVNRNKMTIEKTFPTSPIDVLYKSDVFMQQWRILLRDDDRQKLETYRNLSKRWLKNFSNKARHRIAEDIFL